GNGALDFIALAEPGASILNHGNRRVYCAFRRSLFIRVDSANERESNQRGDAGAVMFFHILNFIMPNEPELKLKEGDIAPSFTVETNGGGKISLADFKGKNVILYFYPKDDTPG